MRRPFVTLIHFALALSLLVSATPDPALGASNTSPGRLAAFASVDNVRVGLGPGNASILDVNLLKGRRKHVLTVEAMLSIYSPAGRARLLMVPLVNGVPLNPVGKAAAQICRVAVQCSVTGVWWLDLDSAEETNPGQFIGKPLSVTLVGDDQAITGSVGSMILRARLEAK